MNKQGANGIEWCDFTWNPTAGCLHGCTWEMPDGNVTQCYAKTVAERVAGKVYPAGFEHHYWHPARLEEPLKVKKPGKIFVGSMADVFGHWVPAEQIAAVLDTMRRADWHTFLTLSKNPLRIPEFNPFPANVWTGVSLPAGHRMSAGGAAKALRVYLRYLFQVDAPVRFMSIEPLWFDAAPVFYNWLKEHDKLPFEWVIIGAASNGRTVYQPDAAWVYGLLELFGDAGIPVFFKGNLRGNPAAGVWREEFPVVLGKAAKS